MMAISHYDKCNWQVGTFAKIFPDVFFLSQSVSPMKIPTKPLLEKMVKGMRISILVSECVCLVGCFLPFSIGCLLL